MPADKVGKDIGIQRLGGGNDPAFPERPVAVTAFGKETGQYDSVECLVSQGGIRACLRNCQKITDMGRPLTPWI